MLIPPFIIVRIIKKFFEDKDRNDEPLGKDVEVFQDTENLSQVKTVRTKHIKQELYVTVEQRNYNGEFDPGSG